MALTTGWEPDTPVEDTLLRRFVFGLAEAFEPAVSAMGGRVARTAAYAIADFGRPAGMGNAVTLLQPLPPDPVEVLDGIEAAVAGGTGTVFLLSAWPTPDLHPRGWRLAGHPPFHVRPAAPLPDATPVPGLRIEQARDAATLRDAERVIVDGYPFADLQPFVPGALFDERVLAAGTHLEVGYRDGPRPGRDGRRSGLPSDGPADRVEADTDASVQEAVFFAVADLLNLEVDLLFSHIDTDTTSTYFESATPKTPTATPPRAKAGRRGSDASGTPRPTAGTCLRS